MLGYPLNWMIVQQGPNELTTCAGWELFGVFTHLTSYFFLFFILLTEMHHDID